MALTFILNPRRVFDLRTTSQSLFDRAETTSLRPDISAVIGVVGKRNFRTRASDINEKSEAGSINALAENNVPCEPSLRTAVPSSLFLSSKRVSDWVRLENTWPALALEVEGC